MPMNDKVPSPLDSPTLADPLECPPLRWGLIGCGRVSHDFCQALQHLPTARVVACATARDVNRAKEFATKHGIDAAYGTYEELVQDPNVDICYVGNVHAFRLQVGGTFFLFLADAKSKAEDVFPCFLSRHLACLF